MAINKTKDVNTNLSDESKSFQDRIDEIRTLVEENLRYTKSLNQASGAKQDLKGQQNLQKLLQENLKVSKELYEMTKKIRRWVTMQRVWGILKILIILIPIILGAIYLPPLVRKGLDPISQLYREFSELTQVEKNQDLIIQQFSGQLNTNEAVQE